MLRDKIIRAWKDPLYRDSLSEKERAALPENPAGAIELTDEELDMAVGRGGPSYRPSRGAGKLRNKSNSGSNSGSYNLGSQIRTWSNYLSR